MSRSRNCITWARLTGIGVDFEFESKESNIKLSFRVTFRQSMGSYLENMKNNIDSCTSTLL